MSRQLNPAQMWSQQPLASRTASVIKSIQSGTIALPNGNTTGTATISAVTTAKSMITLNGLSSTSGNATYPHTRMGYIALTNTTTVTATRGVGVDDLTVAYQVVEHY
jgi:hypothetical protein